MTNSSGQNWSREEVESIVADYFDMLGKELKEQQYNKTEHRNRLAKLLDSRSHGSIERKHQNISAVLDSLKIPYIRGYKPLYNFQRLLFEVVQARLNSSPKLVELIDNYVQKPVSLPAVNDILATLVKPPVVDTVGANLFKLEARDFAPKFGVDYFAKEARNQFLGLAGEEYVLRFEKARLRAEGKESLASKVEHISITQGDGAGFDILSFEHTGQERLIEVKTTSLGPLVPFFVTRNELETSRREIQHYYLYRVFGFRHQPKLFYKQGSLEQSFKLDPTEYMARTG
ncbi:MAG: DUF3883 domain-containing protein [Petrimonas sp.]|jgi:hypothetical protein|nr:DUF3883 domain-containing protein [Petrimonas sp.]